jgi:hypothetical protein
MEFSPRSMQRRQTPLLGLPPYLPIPQTLTSSETGVACWQIIIND